MKNIIVLGGGVSGLGASFLAKKKGYNFFLSDKGNIKNTDKDFLNKNNIPFEEGGHTENKILSSNIIIKSPGIPNNIEILKKAKEKNIEIISEIEFAYRHTNEFIIGVTGSNGKTTTSSLIYHILKGAGLEVSLCGNIGDSFAMQVAKNDTKYYVLEISSFQLDNINTFKPNISLITNLSPDHLDRYENSFENYAKAKLNITKYQNSEDTFFYNKDDKYLSNLIEKQKIESNEIGFSINNKIPFEKEKLNIKGEHNLYNSLSAYLISEKLNISKEKITKGLYSFKAVEHRLEFVKNINEIDFINDSKATNVDATFYALQAMEKDIIWIVGGVDKGNDYSYLDKFIHKVKGIICLGKDNEKIKEYYSGRVERIFEASSMKEAIEKSFNIAQKKQVVLLSPCCASFDLFSSYEDRGIQFKQEVLKLSK